MLHRFFSSYCIGGALVLSMDPVIGAAKLAWSHELVVDEFWMSSGIAIICCICYKPSVATIVVTYRWSWRREGHWCRRDVGLGHLVKGDMWCTSAWRIHTMATKRDVLNWTSSWLGGDARKSLKYDILSVVFLITSYFGEPDLTFLRYYAHA